MSVELNSKEVAFNKIVQWLKENHFQIQEITRKPDPNAETQFAARITFPSKYEIIITITFGKKFRDNFSMGMTIVLDKDIANSILALKDEVKKQQFYMDIKRMAFSLGFHCDTNFPNIEIHRNIFIDSLNNKQFFFDCIFGLVHILELVHMRLDEFYYSIFPSRNKK